MPKNVASSLAVAAVLLLAACSKSEPAGQVAATVNGKEVTLQEVNAEIQASNFPASLDKKLAQKIALQRVVDRKLVIAAASDKGIDKSPEYLSNKRRNEEMLLAQMYARQQFAAVPVPTDADVAKFEADHPNAFASREQLALDQIRFPIPAKPEVLNQLRGDHDMNAVSATLTRLGIKFERGNTGIDSAALPSDLMKTLAGMSPGEPFALPANGIMTINAIVSRKPIATPAPQARAAAGNAWRQNKFSTMLDQQVENMRKSAKINYQNGFGPPPAPAASAPKG